MNSAMEIMNKGMNLLVRELGVVEAEQFISIINRERFDYTKWQEHLFENMSLDEINNAAVDFANNHPL